MKKRLLLALAAIALVPLSITACSNEADPEPTPEPEKETFTVKFVDGEEVLHTVEVEEGKTVSEWDPSTKVTDKEFYGWYAEPTLTHEFNFTTAITEDTTIFGSFAVFSEDTREWVVAGSGVSKVLETSSRGTVVHDEHKMSKQKVDGQNVFTFTMDLFAGDQFQFMVPVYDEETGAIAWGAQRGGGYLQEPGENFSTGGGLGGNTQKTNITTNVAGNYTFTLYTFPANDLYFDDETDNPNQNYNNQDYITWKRNGDTTQVVEERQTSFYIKGKDISDWKDMLNDYTIMKANEDRSVHTLSIYLKEGDEIMFASRVKNMETQEETAGNDYIKGSNVDEASKVYVSGESNMTTLVSGLYTFTYKVEEKVLSISVDEEYQIPKYDYYVNGNFDNDPNWANKVGFDAYKLVQDSEDPFIYKISGLNLKVDEELGIQSTALGDASEKVNFFAYTYLRPATTGFVKAENGNNIVCDSEGKYDLEFNTYRMMITLTASQA